MKSRLLAAGALAAVTLGTACSPSAKQASPESSHNFETAPAVSTPSPSPNILKGLGRCLTARLSLKAGDVKDLAPVVPRIGDLGGYVRTADGKSVILGIGAIDKLDPANIHTSIYQGYPVTLTQADAHRAPLVEVNDESTTAIAVSVIPTEKNPDPSAVGVIVDYCYPNGVVPSGSHS